MLVGAVAVSVALTGCVSSGTTRIRVDTFDSHPAIHLPKPKGFKPRTVKWVVVTPQNAAEVFDGLAARGVRPILFALTADGLTEMQRNQLDALHATKRWRAIVVAYEKYYGK